MSTTRKLRRFAKRRTAVTTPVETPMPRIAKAGLLSGLTNDELTAVLADAHRRAVDGDGE